MDTCTDCTRPATERVFAGRDTTGKARYVDLCRTHAIEAETERRMKGWLE